MSTCVDVDEDNGEILVLIVRFLGERMNDALLYFLGKLYLPKKTL